MIVDICEMTSHDSKFCFKYTHWKKLLAGESFNIVTLWNIEIAKIIG